MKFVTEIVTGDCPECEARTMLVNVYTNVYRCVNCGEDVEQKVNGVIKYIPRLSQTTIQSKLADYFNGEEV